HAYFTWARSVLRPDARCCWAPKQAARRRTRVRRDADSKWLGEPFQGTPLLRLPSGSRRWLTIALRYETHWIGTTAGVNRSAPKIRVRTMSLLTLILI